LWIFVIFAADLTPLDRHSEARAGCVRKTQPLSISIYVNRLLLLGSSALVAEHRERPLYRRTAYAARPLRRMARGPGRSASEAPFGWYAHFPLEHLNSDLSE
jgi:hypothetical protein